jgi:FkbM family methyltransferase
MRLVDFPAGRQVVVLDHRARRHDFATWEECYIEVLVAHLRPGLVVFDVGAEEGEFTALAAGIVGGPNVHIMEPATWIWPNIKAVWDANLADQPPGGCWAGFIADASTVLPSGFGWPMQTQGPIRTESEFCFLGERPDIPSLTIDDYARIRGIWPDLIMMDVEGAEPKVFRGAAAAIARGCVVFASIHEAHLLARHGGSLEGIQALMGVHGYQGELLGIDHEQHWMWRR